MSLLEVNDLSVHFSVKTPLFGKKKFLRAVNGVSFKMEKGEIIGLVGESGCGKSTLGRALVCLENPTAGKVFINGTTALPICPYVLIKSGDLSN